MSKKFDGWNEIKKQTEQAGNLPQFKAREIYHAKIGENIGVQSTALLVQTKLFSSKRLLNKIGMIKKEDFERLRKQLSNLMFDGGFTPPSESASRPEGNCKGIVPTQNQKVNEAVGDE